LTSHGLIPFFQRLAIAAAVAALRYLKPYKFIRDHSRCPA
jgi:hypothetical protein